jgi:hypothetical protein
VIRFFQWSVLAINVLLFTAAMIGSVMRYSRHWDGKHQIVRYTYYATDPHVLIDTNTTDIQQVAGAPGAFAYANGLHQFNFGLWMFLTSLGALALGTFLFFALCWPGYTSEPTGARLFQVNIAGGHGNLLYTVLIPRVFTHTALLWTLFCILRQYAIMYRMAYISMLFSANMIEMSIAYYYYNDSASAAGKRAKENIGADEDADVPLTMLSYDRADVIPLTEHQIVGAQTNAFLWYSASFALKATVVAAISVAIATVYQRENDGFYGFTTNEKVVVFFFVSYLGAELVMSFLHHFPTHWMVCGNRCLAPDRANHRVIDIIPASYYTLAHMILDAVVFHAVYLTWALLWHW